MKNICDKSRFPFFSLSQNNSYVYVEVESDDNSDDNIIENDAPYIFLFENGLDFYFEHGLYCLKLKFQFELENPIFSKHTKYGKTRTCFSIQLRKMKKEHFSNLDLIMHGDMRSINLIFTILFEINIKN